jgi:DNA-binding response OmpR family regulator
MIASKSFDLAVGGAAFAEAWDLGEVYGDNSLSGGNDMSRILVVDDDQFAAELFAALLRHLGYEVAFATSGAAALEHLDGGLPDLVILDVMMPELNGVELLRLIRANAKTADVPVVMYSALDDDDWHAQAMDAGAHDYWIKGGFGFGELEERVRSRLPA